MSRAIIALACLVLAGCGGSGGSIQDVRGENMACDANDLKSWVKSSMDDYYLFYDQLPSVNTSNYEDPEEYIRALRVSPYDRYSYVTDQAINEALFEEGKFFGFGMRIKRTDDQKLYFTLIEPLSPMGQAGAERGDELLAINGVTPDGFTSEFLTAAFGGKDESIDMTVTVRKRQTNSQQDITVTKALYDVQTVLDTKVIAHNNHRVGYLSFLSFLGTSKEELTTAFDTLKNENIDELVLDLRHNGGGLVAVAEQIGSLVAGSAVENTTFTRYEYNDKYTSENTSYPFQSRDNALNLPRLYVLTSPDTCSASEMVINSLKPFIEVVTIGDTTCGKPYATRGRDYCGKTINALEISLLNATNVGGYYDGIAADCPVSEDLSQALGDTGENLLSSALYHLDNAQCQTNFAGREKPAARVLHVEGPEPMDPSYNEIRPLLAK